MSIWTRFKHLTSVSDEIDVALAAEKIKSNIWFKGSNVWILAFSIVIASVGLNVNSTAVIIGAMLISPLMGPIIGIGLSLGTNDFELMKNAGKNLLIMLVISLAASCMFFLISPLELVNPTELEARTSPTIYDVLIALFGGFAGILENCRKEKGTVLSGVAIATALMPPICTAGYGLANGNWHFFSGALFLFLINCVFIIIATYVIVKYFHFNEVEFTNPTIRKRTRTTMSVIVALVFVPSVLSAITVVSDNNFQRNVHEFVSSNKFIGTSYIYDFKVFPGRHRHAEIYIAGQALTEKDKKDMYDAAAIYGIKQEQMNIKEHVMGIRSNDEAERMVSSIYKSANEEMATLRARIRELENELAEQNSNKLQYEQIAREIRYNYPEISDITIGQGAMVDDSLRVKECITVLAVSKEPLSKETSEKMENWLKVRLNNEEIKVQTVSR